MKKAPWILLGLVLAAVAAAAAALADLPGPAVSTAAITTLCAAWWVTEALPIPATSLVPLAAFPLAGVLSHGKVAQAYGHSLILLLLGGFIMSTAMEKSGAHRRLALIMIRVVGGTSRRRLVLGFMLATAVSSMWISNTATVLMLLPVALATIERDERLSGDTALAIPLLLGIAYAASIGGMGTPVGTPPNVILMGVYEETLGRSIDFATWMAIGVPVVVVFIPIVWLWLTRRLSSGQRQSEEGRPSAGPWRAAEVRVLLVFGLAALAWVLRTRPYGGWSGLIDASGTGDATVAMAAVLLLFLIPDGKGEALLDWETAVRIPWGLLLLFGGGIAIAKAFEASGLSATLGALLAPLASAPLLVSTIVICLAVTFLTEITSNTATTTLLMPVLAQAAISADVEPALLMVPAALSASCAFMLPVATAPNAIAMGTGRLTIARMAKEGFALNLVGAIVITGLTVLLVGSLIGGGA